MRDGPGNRARVIARDPPGASALLAPDRFCIICPCLSAVRSARVGDKESYWVASLWRRRRHFYQLYFNFEDSAHSVPYKWPCLPRVLCYRG